MGVEIKCEALQKSQMEIKVMGMGKDGYEMKYSPSCLKMFKINTLIVR